MSLLALSPTFGRNGISVDKLGIVLILLLLVVLNLRSVFITVIVVLIPFLPIFLIVIILIPLRNIMERSSHVDAWSRPMPVGGSLNLNPLPNWSRGSFRAQVWGIGLFSLSCSRFGSGTSLSLGYVCQLHTPYKVPLEVQKGVLLLRKVSSRELGGT